jgi:cyclopropane-fatty-acyl-phospholipid synthase
MRASAPSDRRLLKIIQGAFGSCPVRVRLWDGASCYPSTRSDVASITIGDRATLLKLLWNPDFWLGEAYTRDQLSVRGDLLAVLEAIYQNSSEAGPVQSRLERLQTALIDLNSLPAARRNIQQHYDIGNDFYRLWLDRDLVYTCAYFDEADMSLEEAQTAKMDHICRKLRLQRGNTVIEAGCGWGALAIHMASRYGASVRAFNISREQIQFARTRSEELGLGDRIEFIEDDYRNVSGRADAFVSVGMLEHVGMPHYRELGDVIHRVLNPDGGRGLLHFIGRNQPRALNAWIRSRIFPGAYVPTLAEMATRVLEPRNLSILDVENLRLHYAKTLRHWRTRFESTADRVTELYDAEFTRAWRFYLAGSEAAFATGWMQLFQVTFANGGDNRIPWTRRELYQ